MSRYHNRPDNFSSQNYRSNSELSDLNKFVTGFSDSSRSSKSRVSRNNDLSKYGLSRDVDLGTVKDLIDILPPGSTRQRLIRYLAEISIDGNNISGVTIDGDQVREITIDGDVVWQLSGFQEGNNYVLGSDKGATGIIYYYGWYVVLNYTSEVVELDNNFNHVETYSIPESPSQPTGIARNSDFWISDYSEGTVVRYTENLNYQETVNWPISGRPHGMCWSIDDQAFLVANQTNYSIDIMSDNWNEINRIDVSNDMTSPDEVHRANGNYYVLDYDTVYKYDDSWNLLESFQLNTDYGGMHYENGWKFAKNDFNQNADIIAEYTEY